MYKVGGLSNISLFNKSTGEKVLEVNGILEENNITYEPETEFSIDNNLNFNIRNIGGTISGTLDYVGSDLMKILNPELKDQTYKINMEGYHDVPVQKCIHKKKRINKKWAKRYGYEMKKVKVEYIFNRCKFNKNNGEFEMLAEL